MIQRNWTLRSVVHLCNSQPFCWELKTNILNKAGIFRELSQLKLNTHCKQLLEHFLQDQPFFLQASTNKQWIFVISFPLIQCFRSILKIWKESNMLLPLHLYFFHLVCLLRKVLVNLNAFQLHNMIHLDQKLLLELE